MLRLISIRETDTTLVNVATDIMRKPLPRKRIATRAELEIDGERA